MTDRKKERKSGDVHVIRIQYAHMYVMYIVCAIDVQLNCKRVRVRINNCCYTLTRKQEETQRSHSAVSPNGLNNKL